MLFSCHKCGRLISLHSPTNVSARNSIHTISEVFSQETTLQKPLLSTTRKSIVPGFGSLIRLLITLTNKVALR